MGPSILILLSDSFQITSCSTKPNRNRLEHLLCRIVFPLYCSPRRLYRQTEEYHLNITTWYLNYLTHPGKYTWCWSYSSRGKNILLSPFYNTYWTASLMLVLNMDKIWDAYGNNLQCPGSLHCRASTWISRVWVLPLPANSPTRQPSGGCDALTVAGLNFGFINKEYSR